MFKWLIYENVIKCYFITWDKGMIDHILYGIRQFCKNKCIFSILYNIYIVKYFLVKYF